MVFYNRTEAIDKMNGLGSRGEAFVFFTDFLQQHTFIEKPANISSSEFLYNLNGVTNEELNDESCPKVEWNAYPESFEEYEQSFLHVRKNIFAGNSFLTNLTCRTPVDTNLTLADIYRHSRAMYKLWLKDRFVVFSPEIFVRITDGYISSFPMKGTIDSTLPDAENILMADEKEAAEHATIVDLIRNDLSMVAEQVSVNRYRYIDVLNTNNGKILQTSSEICGKLSDGYSSRLGSIMFGMLPAGSITGAPKKKTVEIILEAETYERGFYTGVMGYFDGKNMDSGVMIRFVEQQDGRLFFKSGGGITHRSDAVSEYEEMKKKVYVPIY